MVGQAWDGLVDVLRASSDGALLSTFASLTHQIHEAETDQEAAGRRAKRDIVQGEILRRMGGAS